eukprot:TRINITY_DN9117_c0_g1_i1.p3 TRINITY_DN9117_c0_g1~~TRINITY_DN9117_c0_g1_i1.p3  ORF type:complete len:116 (-),score=28.22 TRINITY_DN9117_c0_g1_i1:65-412(-)
MSRNFLLFLSERLRQLNGTCRGRYRFEEDRGAVTVRLRQQSKAHPQMKPALIETHLILQNSRHAHSDILRVVEQTVTTQAHQLDDHVQRDKSNTQPYFFFSWRFLQTVKNLGELL